ncbi:MAG: alpha/beta fold hydrolase [Pseudomonadota bacterium]
MTSSIAARPLSYATADGVRLAAESWGDPAHAPVILLHGGGQTRHSWQGTAQRLARGGWYVLAADQRGHGDSDWAPDGEYSLDDYVDDLRRIVVDLDRAPVLVGASLGGLVGLLGEGERHGEFLRALVLVDIVPRIEQRGERHVRHFMTGNPRGFATLEEAADAVASYLPHRPRPDDVSGLERNLRLRDGRYYWHWDGRMMQSFARGAAVRERLDAAARALTLPTLLVRGQISDVVSPEGAREFLAAVPHAQFVEVPGAGHMVAGDSNDVFTDAVLGFLQRLPA